MSLLFASDSNEHKILNKLQRLCELLFKFEWKESERRIRCGKILKELVFVELRTIPNTKSLLEFDNLNKFYLYKTEINFNV